MNLTERLEELADAPAPPMRIDIARATAVGRRRRLRRRVGLVGSVAIVALAAVLATPSIVNSARAPAPDPVAAGGPEGAPLVVYGTFGWLPDSITRVEFGTGQHGNYAHAVNENADLGTHLWLTVYPGTDPPRLGSFGNAEQLKVPAKPVNGQAAYWVTANTWDPLNGGDAYLFWHAGGKLVGLQGYYLKFFDDPQDVLLRVAAGATIGERALPLPVTVKDMPAQYRIGEATFYRPMPRDTGTGAWELALTYTRNGSSFTILVYPEGSLKVSKDNQDTVCKPAKGIDVCVAGAATALQADGGPQGVLDRVTPLGLDESGWLAR
jgi:hypothetical protein